MDEQPVKQAFGSPGGKSYLAPRIVSMIPPHRTYVEPFAGGAAVFFRKAPSEREVLNDKDSEIAFAFRFLRDMTPEQYTRLKKYDWRISRALFKRLKVSKPKDDVERFRQFYYLRGGSFKRAGQTVNTGQLGVTIGLGRLWRVHERLRGIVVRTGDAEKIIRKHDNKTAFFYLDPPYPGRTTVGGPQGTWTNEDLAKLTNVLGTIKGRFALSLGTEHAKHLPPAWHVRRMWVVRTLVPAQTGE